MLKKIVATSIATGLMAAAYQPVMAASPSERVSVKTYEATAKGSTRDDRDEVLDEALYKAAKKTLKNDYDWFRVVNSEFETEKTDVRSSNGVHGSFERVPERRCGLLGCTESYRTTYRGAASSDFHYRDKEKHSVRIEYKMGTGYVEDSENVYDAREVKSWK